MLLAKKFVAEFIGTFWLVFGGCGSAVLAAGFMSTPPQQYPSGDRFSGGRPGFRVDPVDHGLHHRSHFRLPHQLGRLFRPVGRQALSSRGTAPVHRRPGCRRDSRSFVLYLIASGRPGFDLVASGFAANGYGEHSPGGYSLFACLVAEVVLTYIFLLVILGATDSRAPAGFAGLAIGLVLTLIHLVDIPVTNASVNPARSTGPALFVGGWALQQLWLFWVAPILGAVLAGFTYRWLWGNQPD